MTPEILHHNDLLNRRVLNRQTAEEVGRVAELWLDPRNHQILGFSCKAGLLGTRQQAYTWAEIESIGENGIIVSAPAGTTVEKPAIAQPVIGGEVWTEAGNLVGRLLDYRLNLETGDVLDYLFSSDGILGGLADGVYRLSASDVISGGYRRIIVRTAAVEKAELVSEGLTQKVQQATAFLQQDYTRTRQDMNAMLEGTQAIAHQLKAATQKATEKLMDLTDQLQDKTLQASEQTKLKLSQTVSELQEATEAIVERRKEITAGKEERDEGKGEG